MGKPAVLASVVAGLYSPLAHAGAVVELVPRNSGRYFGGESLAVDVWLHSSEQREWLLKYIRLDFEVSDPAIVLADTFDFDFSAIPSGQNFYLAFTFPALPRPTTLQSVDCLCPSEFLPFPEGGSLHIGSIDVTLPGDTGTFVLDVVNAGTLFPVFGARIHPVDDISLIPGEPWTVLTRDFAGGTYAFDLVPEPTYGTLVLLGLLVGTMRPRLPAWAFTG